MTTLDDLVAELTGPADHPDDVPSVAALLTAAAGTVGGDAAARWRQHSARLCRETGDVEGNGWPCARLCTRRPWIDE